MSKVSTQHFKIYEYWKDKAITKDGREVPLDTEEKDTIVVVKDWGEPMCWGCSKPIITHYEMNYNKHEAYDEEDIKMIWSDKKVSSGLNRCHIKPHQFGGEDTPSNLFLMCPDCHYESPDTNNRKAFMRWVYKHRKETIMGEIHPEVYMKLVDEELENRNLPKILTMCNICPNMKFDDWKEFRHDNSGTHGSVCKMSTRVIVLADYFEKKFKEALKETKEVA